MTGRAMVLGSSVGLVAHEILTGPVESNALAFLERLLRLADRNSPEELERRTAKPLRDLQLGSSLSQAPSFLNQGTTQMGTVYHPF